MTRAARTRPWYGRTLAGGRWAGGGVVDGWVREVVEVSSAFACDSLVSSHSRSGQCLVGPHLLR